MTNIRSMGIKWIVLNVFVIGALILATLIPSSWVYNNVQDSILIIEDEGTYISDFNRTDVFVRDYYTDILILNTAVVEYKFGDGLIKHALSNKINKVHEYEYDPIHAFEKSFAKHGENVSYANYYVGIEALIKFLLCFFTVGEIRLIFFVITILLFIYACCELSKESKILAVGFVSAIFASGFLSTCRCISFCTDIIFIFIGCIGIIHLKRHKKDCKENLMCFYFLLGSITFLINYLSWPILPFVFSGVICICINDNVADSLFLNFFYYPIIWLLGYGSEIILRWGINVLLHIDNTMEHILMWGSLDESGRAGVTERIWTVYLCIAKYFRKMNVISFIVTSIVIIIIAMKVDDNVISVKNKDTLFKSISIAFYAFIPLLWLFVFDKHAGHTFDVVMVGGFYFGALIVEAYIIIYLKGVSTKKISNML